MLEKMDDFFNRRIDGYEEHQLNVIDSAHIFYPFTAGLLPQDSNAKVLDLGCGTGLELGYYFTLNPTAMVTCIDIAKDMLDVLGEKFKDKTINIIQGSYFDISFKKNYYNAVVSVESLHHFTKDKKISLYKKVLQALIPNGYFIITDYFASSEEAEHFYQQEFVRLKKEQGISDNDFYHYDTPLTVEHEIQGLQKAGFSSIEIVGKWGATYTLKAIK